MATRTPSRDPRRRAQLQASSGPHSSQSSTSPTTSAPTIPRTTSPSAASSPVLLSASANTSTIVPTSTSPPSSSPSSSHRAHPYNFPGANNYRPREERRSRDHARPRDSYRDDDRSRESHADRSSRHISNSSNNEYASPPATINPAYARQPPPDPRQDRGRLHQRSDRDTVHGASETSSRFRDQPPPPPARKRSPARRERSPPLHDRKYRDSDMSARPPSVPHPLPSKPLPTHAPVSASVPASVPASVAVSAPTSASISSTERGRSPTPVTRYRNPFNRTSEAGLAHTGAASTPTITRPAAMVAALPPPAPSGILQHTPTQPAPMEINLSTTYPPAERGRGRSRSQHMSERRESRERAKARAQSMERGRGRSMERGRGRSMERGRSKSKDRGRSKSRARSKSRYRSRSRPVRSMISMGGMTRRRRSLSRSAHTDYDDDDNDDDSNRWSLSDSHSITTDSDWGNYRTRSESRSRSRSHSRRSTKRLKRRRRERYDSSDISDGGPGTSVESDGAASDSDIPLALRSDRRPLSRASGSSNPLARLDGPMTKMTAEIDSYLDKTMLRLEKTKQGMKKMEKVFKRFQTEMRELEKEMAIYRSQLTTSVHPPPQDTYSAGQSIVQHPRSRTNSTQSEVAAISDSIRKEPIPPPPSLRPVPSTLRLKTEGLGYSVSSYGQGGLNSGVVMLKMSATPSRAVQLAYSGPRSAGYRRVMDKSSYQLPIASQPTMSVLALGKRSRHAGIFGKRRPGFMHLNPFSYQTPFEGIAASSSLDGTIQFWDINKQQLLLSVALKDNRAIPFAEALTWVREDAIAVVSHLKDGVDWPDPGAILTEDPGPLSPPETQTMVLTIYFGQDGKLKHRLLTFLDKPHVRAIFAITPMMRENHALSYITAGKERTLIHWDFEAPDANGMNELRPAGLHQLHRLHSNSVNSLSYCHQSKILYSGGRDKRYIAFDMVHEKVVRQLMLGPIAHIVENPVDPRINLVTLMGTKDQYILMDERTPDSPVLTVGYPSDKTVSRLSAPTWHSEGGLVCAGAVNKGLINLWDVRWSGIGSDFSRRPGAGVVTGDVQFDNVVVGATKHPIFHSTLPAGYRRFGGKTMGGPSQILDVGGEIVMQACFHPNKNVLMVLNRDCSLTFMDYKIRSDLIQ